MKAQRNSETLLYRIARHHSCSSRPHILARHFDGTAVANRPYRNSSVLAGDNRIRLLVFVVVSIPEGALID